MEHRLLIDSPEFWDFLSSDIRKARSHIYIQTLSFEGDEAGLRLANLLLNLSSPARIKILVDNYTRLILSDKFVYWPGNYLNPEVKAERKSTRQMMEALRSSGIQVKFMSPLGPFLNRLAARNHKKLIIIDNEAAYIGGINFSEHNFRWHDMMLRTSKKSLIQFLKEDFESTWRDDCPSRQITSDGLEMFSLDGRSNEHIFQKIFRIIENAKDEIWVNSPYLTFPFVEKLAAARKRGVRVGIITPHHNNRKFLKEYIIWAGETNNLDLWFYQPRMSHLKAMLVDRSYLIMGSSNFDYISYRIHPELLAVVTDRSVINDFIVKVLERDLEVSMNEKQVVSNWRGYYLKYRSLIFGKIFTRLARL